VHVGGRHQRQFVERQHPGGPRRDDESDPAHVAELGVRQQTAQRFMRIVLAERDRVLVCPLGTRAQREDEHVVVDWRAVTQLNPM
jgi:hypothetical protein